jgi:arsenate reductase (glutaredoxin)
MITIYDNPRCTKSREGLNEIESLQQSFTVRKYLDDPITKSELEEVIKKLNIKPIELVRTKENIWIKNYKGKELSNAQIIEILLKNPKLIERPIIVNGNKAIIARPLEKIKEII